MIIEMMGSPGIGKTTVLQRVLRAEPRGRGVRLASTAMFTMIPRAPRLVQCAVRIASTRWLLSNPVTAFLLFRPLRNEERMEAMVNMAPQWEPFLAFCLERGAGNTRPLLIRLCAMQWLLETLQLRAWMALHATRSDAVLMDEPLSYRLSLFDQTPEGLEVARKYYHLMPMPDGVVHFVASTQTILGRLETRHAQSGMVNLRHQGMNRSEREADIEWARTIAALGASILGERGTTVLSLDAELPVDALARELRRFALRLLKT